MRLRAGLGGTFSVVSLSQDDISIMFCSALMGTVLPLIRFCALSLDGLGLPDEDEQSSEEEDDDDESVSDSDSDSDSDVSETFRLDIDADAFIEAILDMISVMVLWFPCESNRSISASFSTSR